MEDMAVNFSHHTILVTGGTGFIGSHLIEKLVQMKNFVISTERSIDPRSYFYQRHLDKSVRIVPCDVRNFPLVQSLVTKYRPEYIFHLAAESLVYTSYDNPKETLDTNIGGTVSVLEATRLYPFIKALVIASSDKAYGKLQKKEYRETDPLRGDHPYEVSKTSADLIASSYWKTYKTPVIVTRFGNVYGEGDLNFSRIIPGILFAIVTNTPLVIRSDGTYTRDYIYVKDVVDGYLKLAQRCTSVKGEAFNFGSLETVSVVKLIELSEKILKKKIRYKIINTAKNEIPHQSLNYRKARHMLGWKPSYSLAKTLPSIYAYYQNLYEMQML